MRRSTLLLTTALPWLSLAPASWAQPTPAAVVPPGPAAAAGATAFPAPAASQGAIRVRTGQHATHGRVVLHLGRIPPHQMRKTANGIELQLQGVYDLNLAGLRPLPNLVSVQAQRQGADTVLLLQLACDCRIEVASGSGMLWLDFAPASTATAAATSAPGAAAARGAARPAAREAARAAETAALRRRLLDEAVRAGLMTRDQAAAMLAAAPAAPPAAPATVAAARRPGTPPAASGAPAVDEAAQLRDHLTAQLAALSGRPQPGATPSSPAAVPTSTPPVRPRCAAPFDMKDWMGEADGVAFGDRLAALRRALARSHEAPAELAALTEFQVAHIFAHEALAALSAPLPDDMAQDLRARLSRVRDVARLLQRLPVDGSSPLLAETADCERDDIGLWRALNAAANGDAATVTRLAPRAREALRAVPERLRFAMTFTLADAMGDDPEALRNLLAPIRTTEATPAEAAARNWLQARIAGAENNREGELLYLRRAANAGRLPPSLFATARLAALQAAQPGLEGERAEASLVDFVRTYRNDALGEEAAVLLAHLFLERGELAEALVAADGASQANTRPGAVSRGTNLAAQILRLLLVDAKGAPLPAPSDRLALFWQFEGYATPGERGDDIRLGAARLMLDQGLAEAALDTVRQLAPVTAQTPAAKLLLARAEASAAQGDPQRALALLRQLPPSDDVKRVAALSLARLGRLLEAANELKGLSGTADLLHRATHLYTARAWTDAAAAYGDVLRDPALDAPRRAEATTRYASAMALAQQRPPAVPAPLLTPADGNTTALLQLTAGTAVAATAARPAIGQLRSALERAKLIESLLQSPAER
ncbi:hypothetical protein [Belnapia moabensis]|uniref:hypothetical protein n=1 Tax=Belnapia moabensis TaxID=365533 RepID=UPI0006948BF8|nr:hypothetical protein [Belnapia moabensis]